MGLENRVDALLCSCQRSTSQACDNFRETHFKFALIPVIALRYAFFQERGSNLLVIWNLRKIVLLIIMAALILPNLPMAHALSPALPRSPPESSNRAVIISSLDKFSPMRKADLQSLNNSLTSAGYTVTYLKDGEVTVDLLTTQLNNYQVIIWRTDTYEQNHIVYWYLGQEVNKASTQAYATDFTTNDLDSSHGIIGANVNFFSNHFTPSTLPNVKLMIIISSMSSLLAPYFETAGVKAVIDFAGVIDLQFNWVDYLTAAIVRLLADGYSVADAVYDVIDPMYTMILRDPLDSMQIPNVSYSGDSALTIT